MLFYKTLIGFIDLIASAVRIILIIPPSEDNADVEKFVKSTVGAPRFHRWFNENLRWDGYDGYDAYIYSICMYYVCIYGKMNSYPDLSIFINISSFAIPFLTVKPEDMMDKYRLWWIVVDHDREWHYSVYFGNDHSPL